MRMKSWNSSFYCLVPTRRAYLVAVSASASSRIYPTSQTSTAQLSVHHYQASSCQKIIAIFVFEKKSTALTILTVADIDMTTESTGFIELWKTIETGQSTSCYLSFDLGLDYRWPHIPRSSIETQLCLPGARRPPYST